MYQSYLGASLHEFVRDKKQHMQAQSSEKVTDKDVIVEMLKEEYREEYVEDYVL